MTKQMPVASKTATWGGSWYDPGMADGQRTGDGSGVLTALAEGKRVVLYTPGLPQAPKNRALAAALASAQRELKSWGVIFSDGAARHVITAQQAKQLRLSGKQPGPGAVLTPLAKEILEGLD